MPDIKVGEHIDRDCKSDPAQRKRKVHIISFFGVFFNPANSLKVSIHFNFSYFQIFTNKCSKGGCKQKEMMRVTCDQCHLNFCLKHRHPLDHDCKTDGNPLSKSGWVESHDPFRFVLFEFRWMYIVHLCFHPLMCDFMFHARNAAVMRAGASSTSASGSSSSSASGNTRPASNGVSAHRRSHTSR